MGDVEETVTTVEIDEETYEEIYKVRMYMNCNEIQILNEYLLTEKCRWTSHTF